MYLGSADMAGEPLKDIEWASGAVPLKPTSSELWLFRHRGCQVYGKHGSPRGDFTVYFEQNAIVAGEPYLMTYFDAEISDFPPHPR